MSIDRVLLPVLLMALVPVAATAQGSGYAWANNPAAPSYTPSSTYSYNSSGGGISASRSGAGNYQIRFAGLGGGRSAGGNVLVTAYGGGREYCNVRNWNSGGADFIVNVRCFTADGQLADSAYSIRVAWPPASPAGKRGYAWANNPTAGSYTPSTGYSFNSSGGGITATRSSAGAYSMTFAGLGGAGSAGGSVLVTAYGAGDEYCKVANWGSGGPDFSVNVRCFTPGGQPADSPYSISVGW